MEGSNEDPLDSEDRKNPNDLFELIERLSTRRLDDQRCALPPCTTMQQSPGLLQRMKKENDFLSDLLRSQSGPYPLVVVPPSGGYWIEGQPSPSLASPTVTPPPARIERDETAQLYRRYFYGKEHFNFMCSEESCGPLVLSLRVETLSSQDQVRCLLRTKDGLSHEVYHVESCTSLNPQQVAKIMCEDIPVDRLTPILFPRASEMLMAYDEHVLVNTFKFGIIYQRFGQTTEEEVFSNQSHSKAMEEFLDMLGQRVSLRDFKGFRGGLDANYGQTGDESVYATLADSEVMFHVATLLPYTEGDPQQLQRKRHIGNDIVSIVFQDYDCSPFVPSMVTSHFLHAYLVVRPTQQPDPHQQTRYRVCVTARQGVPSFGPSLPPGGGVFEAGDSLRDFLLCKLINAEMAAYKADQFSRLERRTRVSLLQSLVDEARQRTADFSGLAGVPVDGVRPGEVGPRFLDSVRKAITGRSRSQSVEANLANASAKRTSSNGSLAGIEVSKVPKETLLKISSPTSIRSRDIRGLDSPPWLRSPLSSPDTPPRPSESDSSSLNSLDLEQHSNTQHNGTCNHCADHEVLLRQFEVLKQEMNKLKDDKLELLKQNLACQREMKKLKEKEVKLTTDLSLAKRESSRLQLQLLTSNQESTLPYTPI